MIRPDLNEMFAHVDDYALNAVVLSLNVITSVGLSPYARKRPAKALLPHPISEGRGSMAKRPRLSVPKLKTPNNVYQANLLSTMETSVDGAASNNTTLESAETMQSRISARVRIATPRRSLGDPSEKATRESLDKSPDKKRFEPGTLIAFGGFKKETCLSGQFKSPGGNWLALPPIVAKIGRKNANYVHIGEARVLISGGLEYQVMKRVSILSNDFSQMCTQDVFLF